MYNRCNDSKMSDMFSSLLRCFLFIYFSLCFIIPQKIAQCKSICSEKMASSFNPGFQITPVYTFVCSGPHGPEYSQRRIVTQFSIFSTTCTCTIPFARRSQTVLCFSSLSRVCSELCSYKSFDFLNYHFFIFSSQLYC